MKRVRVYEKKSKKGRGRITGNLFQTFTIN